MERPQRCAEAKSTEFAKRLLKWFKCNNRDLPWRNESSTYKILVSEKLLQQTHVGHVLNVYDEFFEKFPTVRELANASQEEIQETIKSLGFWRTRAKDLKRMAEQLLEEHSGQIPCDKQKLLDLFGIGQYIASAVCCFGFGNKEAIVDVNVRRVTERLFFWEDKLPTDNELLRILLRVIPDGYSKDFNWALLDFAAVICTKNPKCSRCFAKGFCRYFLKMNNRCCKDGSSPTGEEGL